MVWISADEAEPWKAEWIYRQLELTLASPEQVLLDTTSVVYLFHLLCTALYSSNPALGPPAPCACSSLFLSDVRKVFLEQGRLSPGLGCYLWGTPAQSPAREVSELWFRVTSWTGLHKGAQPMVSEDSCKKRQP